MKAVSQGQPVPEPVNRRADLYPLGLLLCEALGGPGAGVEGAKGKPWRHRNSQVSPGLADIVQKCLAGNPAERYLDAATLADDLRRHLNDLPLRGVPNRSFMRTMAKMAKTAALGPGTWNGLVLHPGCSGCGRRFRVRVLLASAFARLKRTWKMDKNSVSNIGFPKPFAF